MGLPSPRRGWILQEGFESQRVPGTAVKALEKTHCDSSSCILFWGRGLVVIGRWPLIWCLRVGCVDVIFEGSFFKPTGDGCQCT